MSPLTARQAGEARAFAAEGIDPRQIATVIGAPVSLVRRALRQARPEQGTS